MDEEWEKRGEVEAPLCKQKPSEYMSHGNWFFATEPEEMLPYVVERIGADKILFASTIRTGTGRFPTWFRRSAAVKDLSESAKEKIWEKNANVLYPCNTKKPVFKTGACSFSTSHGAAMAPPRRGGRGEK